MEEWMFYFLLALAVFAVLMAIKFFPGGNSSERQLAQEAGNQQQRQGNRAGHAQANRRAGVRNRRQVRRVGK